MLTVILSALLACSSGQEEATTQTTPATTTEATPAVTTQASPCVDSTNDGVDDCASQATSTTVATPAEATPVVVTTTEATSAAPAASH